MKFGSAIVSLIVVASLAGALLARAPAERASGAIQDTRMLTEMPNGVKSVACVRIGDGAILAGRQVVLYRLLDLPGGSGVCGGMSGSPIVRANGETIGIHVAQAFVGESPLSAAVPVEAIREYWAHVRAEEPPMKDWCPCVTSGVASGMSVRVLRVWGDTEIGVLGTVSLVDGLSFLAFGHAVRGNGNCAMAVALAPVVGVVSAPDRFQKIAASGPIVGGVYFDGIGGVAGVFGLVPPAVECRVSSRREKGEAVGRACVSWTPVTELLGDSLRDIISGAAAFYDLRDSGSMVVNGTAAFRDGASVDLRLEAGTAEVIAGGIQRTILARIAGGAEVSRVELFLEVR